MRVAPSITLSPEERARLQRWVDRPLDPVRAARARIVLRAARGEENQAIAAAEGISRLTAARWRTRFLRYRLPGLGDRERTAPSTGIPESTVRSIVRASLSRPPPGLRTWSTRSIARTFGVSHMSVRRIWEAYQIRPVRFDVQPLRPDPVDPLAADDIVGLLLDPPTAALIVTLRPKRRRGAPSPEAARPPPDGGLGVVARALPERSSRSAVSSRSELPRLLAGIDRRRPRGETLRLVVSGDPLVARTVERWRVRRPRVDVVELPDWGRWRNRALEEIAEVARSSSGPSTRPPRGEVALSLARSLREYDPGASAFAWLAPRTDEAPDGGARRLRYDLAVTGHPAFKSSGPVSPAMTRGTAVGETTRAMARNVLGRCLRLTRGERVAIETWTTTLSEANAFVLEATRVGARPMLLYQDEPTFWATTSEVSTENLGRVGDHVKAAIERSDAFVSFFGPSDRERWHALPADVQARVCELDDAVYAAAERAGVRACQMALGRASAASARMYDVDLRRWRRELIAGCLVPPERFRKLAHGLAERLGSGKELRVSHSNGTDLTLRLRHRTPNFADGAVNAPRRKGNWSLVTLPAGVVSVAVDERVADGTFRANVRSSVGLSNAVGVFDGGRWTFERGRLVRYAYDEGGTLFDESYRTAGEGRDQLGSIAVGLNDAIRTAPLLEDQGLGTITLHLGRNDFLGGSNRATWWAWLYLRGADLAVDGELVVRRGKICP